MPFKPYKHYPYNYEYDYGEEALEQSFSVMVITKLNTQSYGISVGEPGRVVGEGVYSVGSGVTLIAFPNPHYSFYRWVKSLGDERVEVLGTEATLNIPAGEAEEVKIYAEFKYERDYDELNMYRDVKVAPIDTSDDFDGPSDPEIPDEPSDPEIPDEPVLNQVTLSVVNAEALPLVLQVEGATVRVYSDSELSELVDTFVTGLDGTVVIELEEGTYWFSASMDGFEEQDKSHYVDGDMTVTFELMPIIVLYSVTLSVVDGDASPLEGATVSVYSDLDYTDLVDTFITGGAGTVVAELEEGTYWFSASLDNYVTDSKDWFIDDDMTVTFELMPDIVSFAVTFRESGGYENVEIDIFSNETLDIQVGGTLYTDSSGEVSVDLEIGDYWYSVTPHSLDGFYDNYTGSFTVSATQFEDFTLPQWELMTFEIVNEVEGAEIIIYSDISYTMAYSDPFYTNENGVATIRLPQDTYWYTVVADGFKTRLGTLLNEGLSVTERFTLRVAYSATFTEDNLESFSLQIWDNENKVMMEEIEIGSSSGDGVFSVVLEPGDYWFTANKGGFSNYEGTFTIVATSININFELIGS